MMTTWSSVLARAALASLAVPGCILVGDDLDDTEQTLTSRPDQNGFIIAGEAQWGGWQVNSEFCPVGMFAVGYQMRVEGGQGTGICSNDDDTALNSVSLSCKDPFTGATSSATSHGGVWGDWYGVSSCAGAETGNLVRGGRMRIEASQGGSDDTSANSVQMSCTKRGSIQAPGGGSWGSWNTMSSCPAGTAVCGLNVKFEAPVGGGCNDDDTAMNGLKLECCTLPCSGGCSDGQCSLCESAASCVQDCGFCGDGQCFNETVSSCIQDCGFCGDDICYNETYLSCPIDPCPPPTCLREPC